jgi:hypothetical protein
MDSLPPYLQEFCVGMLSDLIAHSAAAMLRVAPASPGAVVIVDPAELRELAHAVPESRDGPSAVRLAAAMLDKEDLRARDVRCVMFALLEPSADDMVFMRDAWPEVDTLVVGMWDPCKEASRAGITAFGATDDNSRETLVLSHTHPVVAEACKALRPYLFYRARGRPYMTLVRYTLPCTSVIYPRPDAYKLDTVVYPYWLQILAECDVLVVHHREVLAVLTPEFGKRLPHVRAVVVIDAQIPPRPLPQIEGMHVVDRLPPPDAGYIHYGVVDYDIVSRVLGVVTADVQFLVRDSMIEGAGEVPHLGSTSSYDASQVHSQPYACELLDKVPVCVIASFIMPRRQQ